MYYYYSESRYAIIIYENFKNITFEIFYGRFIGPLTSNISRFEFIDSLAYIDALSMFEEVSILYCVGECICCQYRSWLPPVLTGRKPIHRSTKVVKPSENHS